MFLLVFACFSETNSLFALFMSGIFLIVVTKEVTTRSLNNPSRKEVSSFKKVGYPLLYFLFVSVVLFVCFCLIFVSCFFIN